MRVLLDKLQRNPRRHPLADETADVFFSYNSNDRDAVRRIAEKMRRQGVRVFMDEEDLPYGRPWQPQVEKALKKVRSAVILLGPAGFGDWQTEEARLCQTQGVKRDIPVTSVLLPGGPSPDSLPDFLRERTCADLRNDASGLVLARLIRQIRELGADQHDPPQSARSSTAPRIHNLPFLSLGDLLKGRDDELQRLITNLHSPAQATAITQAIHGLGGIGKTRLAVEYAWRSSDRYDAALFVTADSPETLRSGLASLAQPRILNLPEYRAGSEPETVEAVLVWLRDHDRWLLILDNIDTEDAARAVREILPKLGSGHVLLTSRRREWPSAVRKQPLGELTLEEAAQFLLQRTEGERTPTSGDAEQAGRLAEILGGLPLALEQAAAYIVHHQTTFAGYLQDWERERQRVLEWHDENLMEYPASVAATWQTTFRQLSPKAAALLRLTAFLAPEPIPEAMFEEGEAIVEEAAEAYMEETGQPKTERTVRDSLAELAAYSMVTRSVGSVTVHRIVQEVLRGRIAEDRLRAWIDRSLRSVDDFSPPEPGDVRTWPVWGALRPHASEVLRYADDAGIASPTSRLMSQLEQYLDAKGLYSEAEPFSRRSLAIEEKLGSNQAAIAIHLNNLASLLKVTNRLSEAEPLMRRALQIDEDSFGPQHPNVARDLNNLAQLLKATNRLSEAEPLMRRALQIDEDSLGPQHPNVARDLNNLAQLLQDTNRLSEAEPLMRRALQIDEDSFGTQHPNVAIRLNNLASLLQATNRLSEAEPLMRRALQIDEDSFGPQHPNVARDLNNLAQLLKDTNRLSEAEPLMRRAMEIFEASLGPGHPSTQIVQSNLKALLAEMEPEG